MKTTKNTHVFHHILLPVIVIILLAVIGSGLFFKSERSVNPEASASVSLPADVNNSGTVDISDISMVLDKWGTNDSACDVHQDGVVNISDISAVLSKWGMSTTPRTMSAGARLPISYDINGLTGTKRYVATTGNDTTGTGTINAPYATIKKAESVAANGDTIVVRGGTYAAGSNATTVDRSDLTIIAYPGETPIFDGSIAAPGTATTEGTLKYFSYQPMPAGTGQGLVIANLPGATFSGTTPTGMAAERGWRCVTGSTTYTVPGTITTSNPSGCGTVTNARVITGYYPDQVWVNGTPLMQVLDKSKVNDGTFWLDRTDATDAAPATTNLYISANNAANMSNVRVSSSSGTFLQISAANVKVAGIKIINNSPTWAKTTVLINNNYDVLENVVIDSGASGALIIAAGNTIGTFATGNTLRSVTISRSGWTGAVLYYNDDTTLESVLFQDNEQTKEFYSSPQRGAVKATKSDRTRVLRSVFSGNTLGLWFDQSNYKTDVVGNRFENNSDSAVFYEISHGLTLVNNLMLGTSTSAVTLRLAGSSDMKIMNNTITGGKDLIWLGQDPRSKTFVSSGGDARPCSEYTYRYTKTGDYATDCNVGYSSDFDAGRPGAYSPTGQANLTPGMDWNNSFTIFVNNVLADSKGTANCGSNVVLICASGYTKYTSSTLGPIYEHADLSKVFSSALLMNGNLYQNGSGKIILISADGAVSQQGGFSATDISGLKGSSGFGSSFYTLTVEASGLSAASGLVDANGVVAGSVNHTNAAPAPIDSDINTYIPAGTRQYGILP